MLRDSKVVGYHCTRYQKHANITHKNTNTYIKMSVFRIQRIISLCYGIFISSKHLNEPAG